MSNRYSQRCFFLLCLTTLLSNTALSATLEQRFRGLYVGAGLGGTSVTAKESVAGSGNTTVSDPTSSFLLTGDIPLRSNAHMGRSALLGIVYTGYAYTWNPLYLGGELSINLSQYDMASDRSTGLSENLSFGGPTVELTGSSSVVQSKAKISPAQFSISIRPGVLLSDHGLLYGRAGLALANINYQVTTLSTNTILGFPSNPIVLSVSSHRRRAAPQLGGGLEYALNERWSIRVDYLYTYYGKLQSTSNTTLPLVITNAGVSAQIGTATAIQNNQLQVQDQTVTLGFGYHFN